jgi:hypothetical protein
MTSFHDDTPFWDEPDWSGITETPRPRRTSGERTRTHHVVRRQTPLPPLDRSGDADFWSEGWPDDEHPADVDAWVEPLETVPPRTGSRRRGLGVDPRLLRLGALTAAVVLMVPIALALRDDGGGGGDLRSTDGAAGAASTTTAAPSLLADAGAGHQRRAREARPAKQSTSTLAEVTAATAAAAGADVKGDVMSVSLAATRDEPACAGKYTVVAGDYWVRFAESSGAELGACVAECQRRDRGDPALRRRRALRPGGCDRPGAASFDDRCAGHDTGSDHHRSSGDDACADDHGCADNYGAADDGCADDDPGTGNHSGAPARPGHSRECRSDHPRRLARRARRPGTRHRPAREQPAA